MYATTMIPPSVREIFLPVAENARTSELTPITATVSMIARISTVIGEMSALKPRINTMLKMFEPIALPSARSLSPFFAATIEVTSSGRDVPIATMVIPTRV